MDHNPLGIVECAALEEVAECSSVRQSVFVVPAVVEVARRRGLFAAAGLDVSRP